MTESESICQYSRLEGAGRYMTGCGVEVAVRLEGKNCPYCKKEFKWPRLVRGEILSNSKYTATEKTHMKQAQKWLATSCKKIALNDDIIHGAKLLIGTFPVNFRDNMIENWQRNTGLKLDPVLKGVEA